MKEGPDWWKNDTPRKKKKTKSTEPAGGKDETGKFNKVIGATVTSSDFGYHLSASTEGLALFELPEPKNGRILLKTSYRSTKKESNIRNAAIVIGDSPTNGETIKIGTAIGMNSHVAFEGGWNNVGSLAKKTDKFQPLDTFEIEIELNLEKHVATAKVNGNQIKFDLPESLNEVQWIGYYVKATESEFSELKISRSDHTKRDKD